MWCCPPRIARNPTPNAADDPRIIKPFKKQKRAGLTPFISILSRLFQYSNSQFLSVPCPESRLGSVTIFDLYVLFLFSTFFAKRVNFDGKGSVRCRPFIPVKKARRLICCCLQAPPHTGRRIYPLHSASVFPFPEGSFKHALLAFRTLGC